MGYALVFIAGLALGNASMVLALSFLRQRRVELGIDRYGDSGTA